MFPVCGGQSEVGRLTEIVVVPRSAELEAAEEVLSRAFIAVVGGTRPMVTVAMVHQQLSAHYGIADESFSVRWHMPEDFIVLFDNRLDRAGCSAVPCYPPPSP